MKVLFITGGSPGSVFDQAPLARATRDAGHDVLVAGPGSVTEVISRCGLPTVAVSPQARQQFTGTTGTPDGMPDGEVAQMRTVGNWYGRTTAAILEPLRCLADDWGPHVVVGGALHYPATLLGRELDLPTVGQPWGWLDPREYHAGARETLRPLLDERGLDGLPEPDLLTEVVPPRFRRPDAPWAQSVRWVPMNVQRPLERWMYTRPDRTRVLLTTGSRPSREGSAHTIGLDALVDLARHIAALDVELVLALPEAVADEVRGELDDPRIRVGWIPLDVVAPTCGLIVHHGGSGTLLTALSSGVPQLIVREIPGSDDVRPLVALGALVDLGMGGHRPEEIVARVREMLADPAFAERSREVAEEIAALPLVSEVVPLMEQMAERAEPYGLATGRRPAAP